MTPTEEVKIRRSFNLDPSLPIFDALDARFVFLQDVYHCVIRLLSADRHVDEIKAKAELQRLISEAHYVQQKG